MTEKSEPVLTKEDFVDSGWEKVVENLEGKDSRSYSSAFYSKTNEIEDEKHKEIFLILATLMAGRLSLTSPNDPFPNIDRFDEAHLNFFSEIVEEVSDNEITLL